MKTRSLFSIGIIWLISARAQDHPVTTIRLDPDSHLGGRVGDFFEKVDVIPLETTSQSLFGSVAHMEVTEDYFIIHDVDDQRRANLLAGR